MTTWDIANWRRELPGETRGYRWSDETVPTMDVTMRGRRVLSAQIGAVGARARGVERKSGEESALVRGQLLAGTSEPHDACTHALTRFRQNVFLTKHALGVKRLVHCKMSSGVWINVGWT